VRTVCPEVSRTAGRVRARHAFLMSQLPAHLGYPKEAIQTLDGKGAAHKRVLLSSPVNGPSCRRCRLPILEGGIRGGVPWVVNAWYWVPD